MLGKFRDKVFGFILSPFKSNSPLRLPLIILLGVLTGILFTIVRISNAGSYLSDDPRACINCHIMNPEYITWSHSSHARVTNCNDCHVPHDNIIRKFWFKANDGMRHATMFTLRLDPEVMNINDAGRRVVQENCLRCHDHVVNKVSAANVNGTNYKHGKGMLCWECHREVPHGRIHSRSATPYTKVPPQNPAVPEWININLRTQPNK